MNLTGGAGPHGAGELRRRYRGALLGVVVGDALGAPFEGHPGLVPATALARVEAGQTALRYTDDTAMTFALAESLLVCGRLDLDHLASSCAAAYQSEPHRGYGVGAAQLLRRVAAGAGWAEAAASQFGGQGSFGNGAAMRVAPIGIWARGSVELAADLGRRSATVTHAHPEGVDAAGVQAAAVTLALVAPRTGSRQWSVGMLRDTAETPGLRSALEVVAGLVPGSSAAGVAAATGTGIVGVEAVPAAIAAAALNLGSFADTIRFAIALGGDTDTIAAMAGAISGARLGEGAIPAVWLDRVEGVDRARELADRFVTAHTSGASRTAGRSSPADQ